jgi:hypothetical protein
MMNTIRKICHIADGTLRIVLPESFKDKRVEVIIQPVNHHSETQNLSDLLLPGPTWSKQQISKFQADNHKGYHH